MMELKLDKNQISFENRKEHDEFDIEYWSKASYDEKARTITFLSESLFRDEKSSGRLQRFYTFIKQQ
ncbi:hypothetical protein JW890_01150 [candidate division WOR-3 bacterium]|nr:hypothetical protein [candidate division WOR-3 bacterium]